jgi:hypothetical protein
LNQTLCYLNHGNESNAVKLKNQISLSVLFTLMLIGCSSSDSSYTLYRNSPIDEHMRVHVATFDAKDGHDYNMSNCQTAQDLFQNQKGVTAKYWCEKGNFKK